MRKFGYISPPVIVSIIWITSHFKHLGYYFNNNKISIQLILDAGKMIFGFSNLPEPHPKTISKFTTGDHPAPPSIQQTLIGEIEFDAGEMIMLQTHGAHLTIPVSFMFLAAITYSFLKFKQSL